jgi:hypothetical protein
VPKFLNNIRKIDLSIIEKIKKTKSQKVLDFLRKSMKTSLNLKNHYATIAQDKKNAERFLTLLKSKLSEFKVNENMTKQNSLAGPLLSISNKKISLIKEDKEDIELDEWNVEFVNLIRSISVSILHVNKEISDLVIEDFKSNTEKELENLKSDLDLEKDKANQEGKLGFLEKFVCSMGFEVYYFLAEIEFLNKLPNSVEKSFNVSSFEDYLTKAYKDKLGSNTAVFEPLKKAITDFIKKRAANKFNAKLSTKFDEIQKESEDKTKTAGEKYGDQKEAIKLIEKEKNIKLKIELFAFIEEYYKIIKEEFEKQNSFDSIKNYAKTAIDDDNPKFNKTYAPKNVVKILEGLKDFDKSEIEKEFSELVTKIEDTKKQLDTELKSIESQFKSYEEAPAKKIESKTESKT